MNYDKIGIFIQQKRKDKNLTQKQLAEKIGVTDRAISKWERGKGCPDVSILEILSKELDCSVLELLKGREIENEVIPVTEADDYIKEGLKLSENKVKSIFIKITELAIIFMVILLGYLNVVQVLYIDKVHELSLGGHKSDYSNIDKMINDNLELINNNQGIFKNNDYEVIKEKLDLIYKNIKDTKIYQYVMNNSEIKYTVHDELLLNVTPYVHDKTSLVIETLKKYDDASLVVNYEQISQANIEYSSGLEAFLTYRYRLTPNIDLGEYLYGSDELWAYSTTGQVRRLLSELYYLTEIVKKVGGING